MASGVWSRLRFRLRPSAASRASSKALQTSAGRSDSGVVMASEKSAPGSAGIGDRYVKRITCALRSLVSLLEGGDIQIHCGEVVEHHLGGRTALKLGKSLNVTKTALAGVDYRV